MKWRSRLPTHTLPQSQHTYGHGPTHAQTHTIQYSERSLSTHMSTSSTEEDHWVCFCHITKINVNAMSSCRNKTTEWNKGWANTQSCDKTQDTLGVIHDTSQVQKKEKKKTPAIIQGSYFVIEIQLVVRECKRELWSLQVLMATGQQDSFLLWWLSCKYDKIVQCDVKKKDWNWGN